MPNKRTLVRILKNEGSRYAPVALRLGGTTFDCPVVTPSHSIRTSRPNYNDGSYVEGLPTAGASSSLAAESNVARSSCATDGCVAATESCSMGAYCSVKLVNEASKPLKSTWK